MLPFIYCRTEPQIFSCRFTTWDEVLGVDYTKTPQLLEKHAIAKASANHCTVDCWQVIHEIVELVIFFFQKKNPQGEVEKQAAKVDLSPLFLPRELPLSSREAVRFLKL